MNSNETRTFYISLAAGLFAAFLLYSYSQEKKKEYDGLYGKMANVVVARVDISEMQTIDSTMIEVIQKPADFVEPEGLKDPDVVEGQVAAIVIKKGQQITQQKLLQAGPSTGISLQVAPTKRALALPIDESRGVSKLIRPGDRVDITAAIDSGKGVNQKREVSIIMQDVVILATGMQVMNNLPRVFELDASGKNMNMFPLTGDTKYNTVTIEATPKEAQDLIYLMATSPGNIFLTLRNPNDRQIPPRLPAATSDSIAGKPLLSPDLPSLISSPPASVPAAVSRPQPKAPGRAPERYRNN